MEQAKKIGMNKEPFSIWRIQAYDLRASAGLLWYAIENNDHTQMKGYLGLSEGIDIGASCKRTYCMIAGLAFELLLKSIVLEKKPNISFIDSHNLLHLLKICEIEICQDELNILNLLTEYVVWAGRYPIPKKAEDIVRYNNIFNRTVVDFSQTGNTTTLKYNGSLEWESVMKLWRTFEDIIAL